VRDRDGALELELPEDSVAGDALQIDGADAFENVEFRQIDDIAQLDPFGDRRNEERRASFGGKTGSDCRCASILPWSRHVALSTD